MTRIIEDYVSFEVAKLLKEKGFDAPCVKYYSINPNNPRLEFRTPKQQLDGTITTTNSCLDEEDAPFSWISYAAPTLQMAMKWLREVHHLYIQFVLNQDVIDEKSVIKNYYHFNVSRLDHFANEGGDCKWYKSYEEVCEGAIKYCLENLI